MISKTVNIVGGGLAGSEAAYQLAKKGIKVNLYEMRPIQQTDVHETDHLAELVCSNSLRSNDVNNAVGLLKEEMRLLDSLIIRAADKYAIPAGSALAVDRKGFSEYITEMIEKDPNITIIREEIVEIPEGVTILATGPLTSHGLSNTIQEYFGLDYYYFYDAVAPIIEKDSINMDIAYYKSRYDKGTADYINCPMSKEEFYNFYHELIKAEKVKDTSYEDQSFFEGCMPVEQIASRGAQTLLHGPLKPVGLEHEGEKPYAVVQLRQDNAAGSLYNMVGFQTRLTWGEQKRIIRMIPGLENAEIIRYGVMHKNSYINAPTLLEKTLQTKKSSKLFIAGQLSGVEGYVESAAMGLLAGLNAARLLLGEELLSLDNDTAIGALAHYIVSANPDNFQPMNINFGIMAKDSSIRNKKERRQHQVETALKKIEEIIKSEE